MNHTIHYGTGYDCPEDLFIINPDVPRGLYIDALNTAHARANGVLSLLVANGTNVEGFESIHPHIMEGIDSARGWLTMAQAIVAYTGE